MARHLREFNMPLLGLMQNKTFDKSILFYENYKNMPMIIVRIYVQLFVCAVMCNVFFHCEFKIP